MMHLDAIHGWLIDKGAALQRLPDLLLAGRFHKERGSISSLHSTARALPDFAGRETSSGIDCAKSNFPTRRGIMDALGAEVILNQEEGTRTLRT